MPCLNGPGQSQKTCGHVLFTMLSTFTMPPSEKTRLSPPMRLLLVKVLPGAYPILECSGRPPTS